MSGVWIALSLAVLGVIVATIGRSRGQRLSDLGSVSDQWIAEHRSQTRNQPR
jgi:hypothetical protein